MKIITSVIKDRNVHWGSRCSMSTLSNIYTGAGFVQWFQNPAQADEIGALGQREGRSFRDRWWRAALQGAPWPGLARGLGRTGQIPTSSAPEQQVSGGRAGTWGTWKSFKTKPVFCFTPICLSQFFFWMNVAGLSEDAFFSRLQFRSWSERPQTCQGKEFNWDPQHPWSTVCLWSC